MDQPFVTPITFDVIRGGVIVGTELVAEPFVVLGRDGAAHLWVDDPALSACHVMIESSANEVSLVSLGAETFVNGLAVERCLLCSGDELRVGHTTMRITFGEPVEFVAKRAVASEPAVEAIVATHYRDTARAERPVIDAMNLLEARSISEDDEREAGAPSVVELSIVWNDKLLHVAHIEGDERFVLRSEPSTWAGAGFVVGSDVLGALSECAVVLRRARVQHFVFAPSASGSLEREGVSKPLDTLIAEGIARPSSEAPGAYEVELRPGDRCSMEAAGLTIRAKRVARARDTRLAPTRDKLWNGALFAALVLVFGSLLVGRVAMAMGTDGRARATAEERLDYVRGLIARQQRRSEERAASERSAEQLNRAIERRGANRFGPESSTRRRRSQRWINERQQTFARGTRHTWADEASRPSSTAASASAFGAASAPDVSGLFCTRGAHEPRVRPRVPTVTGLIAPEAIRRVVVRNLAQLRFCYGTALRTRPQLAGRVAMRFIIGGTGMVMGATVHEASVDDRDLGLCMARAIRTMQFPAPEGRGIVSVIYPFELDPAND
jgi:hypothetical protein